LTSSWATRFDVTKEEITMCQKEKVRRGGFTLIELLVVIAIISLLVSILLPSLTKAKDLAMTVKCMSNLKNTGLAMLMYAGDNDLWTPPPIDPAGGVLPGTNWLGNIHWTVRLALLGYAEGQAVNQHYLSTEPDKGGPSIFACPGYNPFGFRAKQPALGSYGLRRTSYCQMFWHLTDPVEALSARDHPTDYGTRKYDIDVIDPSGAAKHTSSLVLVGDSRCRSEFGATSYGLSQVSFFYPDLIGDESLLHTRHHDRANVLFGDGHAGSEGGEALWDDYGVKAVWGMDENLDVWGE